MRRTIKRFVWMLIIAHVFYMFSLYLPADVFAAKEYKDIRELEPPKQDYDKAIKLIEKASENQLKAYIAGIDNTNITTLNDMIDVHVDRLVVNLSVRVPPALIGGILVVCFLTLLLLGLHGGYIKERNVLAQFILVLIISVVVYLIIDLDRSQEGFMQISKDALVELHQSLNP